MVRRFEDGMPGYYILTCDGTPIREPSHLVWARWMAAENERRRVARTRIGDIEISTVFLGLDHGWARDNDPVLWETMIFGGEHDQEMERYTSLVAARKGHNEWVGRITRETLPP